MALNQLGVTNSLSQTAQAVTDEDGNASALQLATNGIAVGDTPISLRSQADPYHIIGYTNQGLAGSDDADYWNFNGALVFAQGPNTSPVPRMVVTGGGNVGIGTTTPQVALDVSGTVQATGLNITGGLTLGALASASTAPSTATLRGLVVDTSTGTLYVLD